MSLEALNHIGYIKRDVIIVFNDNDWSIAPNVGALSNFSKQATAEKRAEIDKFTGTAVNRLRTVQRMAVNRRITLVKYEIQGIMQDLDYRQKHGAKEILGYSMKPFNILNSTVNSNSVYDLYLYDAKNYLVVNTSLDSLNAYLLNDSYIQNNTLYCISNLIFFISFFF